MPRLTALAILQSKNALTLRAVDRAARERDLSDKDRALVRRIIGTEVRRRATLRALVATFARGKPPPAVKDCIAIGLVQIFFLDTIPDHVAIAETARAAQEMLGPKKARYVEGVLRAAVRARGRGKSGDPRRDLALRDVNVTIPVFSDPAQHPLLWAEEALSMPVALVKRWVRRYGEERAFQIARDALEEPDLSLRVVRGEREDIEARLADARTRHGHHPRILIAPMKSARTIVRSQPFLDGAITIQGETALRAAELVDAEENERVLDLCAAPGGKTAVLAATGARVTACDDDERRVQRLRETLARIVPHATVETRVQDGAAGLDPGSFDAVLVDVPCSNTGVLAARPSARWRFSAQSQSDLATLQTRLFAEAATCVKPGGRLVYSTCSIEPEENHRRVRAFAETHPEFAIEREIEALPEPRGERGPVDGGYAARLIRRS
jgi:16S rRNA (cytosine967-C5)-methyltransferase